MKLSKKEKKLIVEAYNVGDFQWLQMIFRIVANKSNNENIMKLLNILFKMNFIIVETETEKYASKYNRQVQNLYSEMKVDLMKLLNYEEMWEEIY